MSVKSRIFTSEAVTNTVRHAAADTVYLVAYVELQDGTLKPALFTDGELQKAMARAAKNPEDLQPPYLEPAPVEITAEQKSWLARLFGR